MLHVGCMTKRYERTIHIGLAAIDVIIRLRQARLQAGFAEEGPDDGNHRRPDYVPGDTQRDKKGLTSQGEPASPAQVATASSAKG